MRDLVRALPEELSIPGSYLDKITEIEQSLAAKLADECLDSYSQYASQNLRVTDKMLGNYARLGLVALLFPNARVINCQRHPMDTCLSCYFQHFEQGLQFSYDLENTAVVYRAYRKIMQHWEKALPIPILNVNYEDMLQYPERNSRELIDFCGQDWDSACLDFTNNDRGIHTASAWQVRQPLYHSSVGRWVKYKHHLQPLIKALGTNFVDYNSCKR